MHVLKLAEVSAPFIIVFFEGTAKLAYDYIKRRDNCFEVTTAIHAHSRTVYTSNSNAELMNSADKYT